MSHKICLESCRRRSGRRRSRVVPPNRPRVSRRRRARAPLRRAAEECRTKSVWRVAAAGQDDAARELSLPTGLAYLVGDVREHLFGARLKNVAQNLSGELPPPVRTTPLESCPSQPASRISSATC